MLPVIVKKLFLIFISCFFLWEEWEHSLFAASSSGSEVNFKQVQSFVDLLPKVYENIFIRKKVLGITKLSYPIYLIHISKLSNFDSKPQILFLGGTHGNEPSAVEVVLSLIKFFIFELNEFQNGIFQAIDLVFIPLLNPDGLYLKRRSNADFVDINRDFTYRDKPYAFSPVRESQLIHKLHENNNIIAALSFHSGSSSVLWPFCHKKEGPADEELFIRAASLLQTTLNLAEKMQSFEDYPSQGEYIDFAYGFYHTIALTIELHKKKSYPKDFSKLCNSVNRGALQFVQLILKEKNLIH